MKKNELIKQIALDIGLPQEKVHATLDRLVEVIYRETKRGGYVRLSKLGTFRGKKQKTKMIFNPATNRTYFRQEGVSPKFKPSQNYRDFLADKEV